MTSRGISRGSLPGRCRGGRSVATGRVRGAARRGRRARQWNGESSWCPCATGSSLAACSDGSAAPTRCWTSVALHLVRWPVAYSPEATAAYGSTRRFGGLRCFLRVCVAVPSEPVSCSSVRGLPEMLGRSRARFARAPWFASVRRLVSRIDRCSEVAAGDRSLPVPCRAIHLAPSDMTSVGQPGSPGLVGRNAELDRLRAHRADRVGALPTG